MAAYLGRMPPRRRRSSPLEGGAAIVLRALAQAGLTEQARRLRIVRHWDQAVGPQIAARTRVQSFCRGTLVVKAASTAWQQELMYLKDNIILQLNARLDRPNVKEIRIISGHLGPKAAQPRPQRVLSPSEQAAVDAAAAPIADAEARAAFARLLRRAKAASAVP